ENVLVVGRFSGDGFAFRCKSTVGNLPDVQLIVAHIPATFAAIETVCRWADSEISCARPVRMVVAGDKTGQCEIRYFVVVVSCGTKRICQHFEMTYRLFVIGWRLFAAPDEFIEGCSLFNGQAVARDMRKPECNHPINILFPLFIAEQRKSVNEIDAEVIKTCRSRICNALKCLLRIVAAVHPFEVLLKKRLNTDAEPVDAAGF